ncbi:interleukin-20 receptor subunit beta [Syngnathus scovelli]|uniref:interleukin-20 receptor subunit beta n=1 Tax=Syngnathus scovelli TaxID=161590 RepID=UPI00210F8E19|nr:cytokine receptor family member B16 [Syngnathus scovelli]
MKTSAAGTFSALLVVGYVWSALPPPSHVTMDSVNVKHMLRWNPPKALCATPLLYSVQFQGEFEATIRAGTWLNSSNCQDVTHTYCDQTLDLGSDSDYNIRVRARCASETSAWARLSPPFNRRDTVLTAPLMKVSTVGDALLVSFEEAPPTAYLEVEVRQSGDTLHQARVFAILAEEKLLHVFDLREESEYCVRARVLLKQLRSQNSQEQCVRVTGPHVNWEGPVTAVLTLLLMAGVVFAALWCAVQWRTRRHSFKESPPRLLLLDGPAPAMPGQPKEEVCANMRVVHKDRRFQLGHNAYG